MVKRPAANMWDGGKGEQLTGGCGMVAELFVAGGKKMGKN